MTSGRRNQLVTLARFATTTDAYGEETQAWSDIGQEWAAAFYGRGDERRQAAMEQGNQPVTFQVLSNTLTRSLTLKDRVTLDSVVFDIVGIAPMNLAEIELTAVLAA